MIFEVFFPLLYYMWEFIIVLLFVNKQKNLYVIVFHIFKFGINSPIDILMIFVNWN
jgi:hypothetical protein